ncbi:MAG: SDR family oxidoreductase [Lentisphaeraceae bacterium]|nr:SDR family oxidoreductase [Lentisphaeraceae bacterium]
MNSAQDSPVRTILVTGATGYVGGRLVPILLKKGYKVRCLVRDPARLEGRAWFNEVEAYTGNVLDEESLKGAMLGVDSAYYLIHSLGGNGDFAIKDKEAARNFSKIAELSQLKNIIYLGGLAQQDENLSKHLKSRQDTGKALREFSTPVTEFRCAVVVGSGSISFELIRYLSERLPLMVCPKWVFTKTQPIGIKGVLEYLSAALENLECKGQIFEIGSSAVMSYGDMMTTYAKIRGLRRLMIPVPVLTPKLSSYWLNFVTPIQASIAKPLVLSMKNENIIKDFSAQKVFPEIKPDTYEEAVRKALERIKHNDIETTWSDALSSSLKDKTPVTMVSKEGLIFEHRQKEIDASAEEIFKVFSGIGGNRGWYYLNWTWKVRGLLDKLIGGVGLRRDRKHPNNLSVGEALDFWRVEAVEKNKMIRLRAEMKVPGKAWLQFKIEPTENGKFMLYQTAFFEPKGVFGLFYWYMLYPAHKIIFSGLINRISEFSEGKREWPKQETTSF